MKKILIAALALLPIPVQAAKPLPPEVQASIDDTLNDCKETPAFKKGFLTRRDINGDGVADFILDYGFFACGAETSLYCGSAGCVTEVFASLPNGRYARVFNDNVRSIDFRKVGGRPAMVLGLHGSACGKVGSEPGGSTLYWDGAKFSPTY